MSGMIDPRTQWIIYKDKERELLSAIQWRQSFTDDKPHTPARPWYTQAADWLSRIEGHSQPGKQKVENVTLACCTACIDNCPAR